METTMRNLRVWSASIFLLLAFGVLVHAQSGTMLPKFNILDDANLVLETEKLNEFDYKFTIVDKTQHGKDTVFVLMPLTPESFIQSFCDAAGDYFAGSKVAITKTESAKGQKLKDEARRIFIFVQAAAIASSESNSNPVAGTICMAKSIEVRQYLRINSNEMRIKGQEFMLIRLKKNQPIETGKMVGSSTLKNASIQGVNGSGKGFSFRSRKVTKELLPDDCLGFSPSEKCYILVSKKDSTGRSIFESFGRKAEAQNRHEYLAAKLLSNDKKLKIASLKTEASKLQSTIDTYEEQIQGRLLRINKLEKDLHQSDSLQDQIDSLKRQLGIFAESFNNYGKELGYSIDDEGKVHVQYRYKRRNEDETLSINEAMQENKGIVPNLKQTISDWEEYVKVLEKMVDNRDKGVDIAKSLSTRDYEILVDFNPFGSDKTEFKDIKAETMAKFRKILILEMKRFLNTDRDKLAIQKSQLENAKNSIEILEDYSATNQLVIKNQSLLNLLRPKEEITGRISSEKDANDSDSTKIKNEREEIVKNNSRINVLSSQDPLPNLSVEYATMEFNQGYMENIVVFGSVGEEDTKRRIKFTNVQPIGFSRKKDFDDLGNFELWTEPVSNNDRTQYVMNLGDFILNYQQNLALNRRDYSPKDGVTTFDLNAETCVKLHKAPSYQLLEGRVFTDFVGLDAKSPNGLAQTEIGHRINLITNRIGHYCWKSGGIRDKSGRLLHRARLYRNNGWFGYIHPMIVVSKIEKNNRALLLESRDRIVNNQYFQERFASTMSLRNYEFLSTGFDLNIKTWDLPFFKSTFYLDFGFRFGRTQVIDSARALVSGTPENTGKGREFGVNTFRYYPKLIWEIKPEERYGLSIAYTWNQFYLWNPKLTQVSVPERYSTFGENSRPFGYGTAELQAYFNPSIDNPTGKLFFRYTFNHQGTEWNTNFHQAQVGYSFFFLGRNKERTQPD